jgi:hypothetical protein
VSLLSRLSAQALGSIPDTGGWDGAVHFEMQVDCRL